MEKRLRVLNVDDDEVARYVKHRILVAAGCEVVDAPDAREALKALRAARPDVALVDMKLPDMSGFELTRRIRLETVGHVPIVQVSAVCVTQDDERDGLDSGADAYVVVPFEAEELVAVVREVARRQAPQQSADPVARARLGRVDAFLRANLHRPLALDDLARAANLSPFYFSRMFKQATGSTPLRHLMAMRVEKAARLVETTPLSMAEIARRSGFRTQAHFSAAFRKIKGSPPSAFRRARAAA